jgi:AraC family transcriptional regulator
MEPKIVDRDQILLVGFSYYGDPFATSAGWTEENEIGRLWRRLETFLRNHGDRVKHVRDESLGYEVHVEHEETAAKGYYEVFVGMEVETLEDMPIEMVSKALPATKYAVYTVSGDQIVSDWATEIFGEWMPGSGYEQAYGYGFQLYDARFKGLDRLDESELDIYVPVRKKA